MTLSLVSGLSYCSKDIKFYEISMRSKACSNKNFKISETHRNLYELVDLHGRVWVGPTGVGIPKCL